jgi:hypothetical protein
MELSEFWCLVSHWLNYVEPNSRRSSAAFRMTLMTLDDICKTLFMTLVFSVKKLASY